MSNKKPKQPVKGFTIVEIMIVLVIAAAIILIVFLTVPALQRNSRNNQRKNDAARVLAAANEWRSHNSNKLPNCEDMDLNARTAGIRPPCADGSREAIEQLAGNLGHYENIWSINTIAVVDVMANDNSLHSQEVVTVVGDSVFIRSQAKCAEPNKLQNASGGIVVVYSQETADGMVLACRG